MSRKGAFKVIYFLLLVAAGALLWSIGLPAYAGHRVKAFLKDSGFTVSEMNGQGRHGGKYIFTGLEFDRDAYSTIEALHADVSWGRLLFPGLFIYSLTVDSAAFTGEFDPVRGWSVEGWKPEAKMPLLQLNEIILNGGKLDLTTPAGSLRFQAKGRMAREGKDGRAATGAVWARQHQLSFNSQWTLTQAHGEGWNADAEFHGGRMNFDNISASRIDGWLTLAAPRPGEYEVNTQFVAGQIRIGSDVVLQDTNIIVRGNPARPYILVKGRGGETQEVDVLAEFKPTEDGTQIDVSLRARDIDDLMNFTVNLNKNLQKTPSRRLLLTRLLLSPGNVERMKKEARDAGYDWLELSVSGSPYDLTGKIIASRSKGDITSNTIISLNPAADAAAEQEQGDAEDE